jgi:hypothetical protein
MTPGEQKARALVTRYVDGAARAIGFREPDHLELLTFVKEHDVLQTVRVDMRTGEVTTKASAVITDPDAGALGSCDFLDARGAFNVDAGRAIEVRDDAGFVGRGRATLTEANTALRDQLAPLGVLVCRLERAGKHPRLRLDDGGETLYSSATEVLSRWDLRTGSCTRKYKCYDRATHVASTHTLVVAQNKEGVICFFDRASGARRVSLRIAPEGWIAFDDDGAWDASPELTRGVELSWSDARSTAFVPDVGFGTLVFNKLPLTEVRASTRSRTPGLLGARLSEA